MQQSATVWLTPSLSSLSVLGFCSSVIGVILFLLLLPHPSSSNVFPSPLYCLHRSSFKSYALNNPWHKYTKPFQLFLHIIFVKYFLIHLTNIHWATTTCQALFRPGFRDAKTNKINPVPSKISSSNKGKRIMCSNPAQMRSREEMFHQNFEVNLGSWPEEVGRAF